MKPTTSSTVSETRYTLKQLGQLAAAYWRSSEKRTAWNLTLALGALTLAQVGLAIWLNYWNRALFDALDAKQLSELLRQVVVFVLIFIATMAITGLHLVVKRRMQLSWRQWLTDELVVNWMTKGQHYKLQYMPGEHDNPDGRIAEDIRIATEVAVGLGHTLLFSLVILGTFIDILWEVSGPATIPGTAIIVPGYLVVLAFIYAGVGTLLGGALGRPLIKSTNSLQTAEANLRFGLARTRESSEAIALLRGEASERRHAKQLFDDVGMGWNRQTVAYLWIVSFSSGYGTLLPLFPILIAAPQYIAGTMTLGLLMQAAQAFQNLTSALSWPINSLGDIARCRASADRVLSLYGDLKQLEADAATTNENRIDVLPASTPVISMRDLSIAGPDGTMLVQRFNAEIHRGERVLITGDSTLAAALFKIFAGLWSWGAGEVSLPMNERMEFLPQRPFLPKGTLREALSYPKSARDFTTSQLEAVLERAHAGVLASRLDEAGSWDRLLTGRMQQRVAFARMLLHRPEWVFIEEAPDVLDRSEEGLLMDALHSELPEATVVTICVQAGLERHHTRKLMLIRVKAAERPLLQANR